MMGASTWDNSPAEAVDNSWKTDGGAADNGWQADASGGGDGGFEISPDNVSKHAGGDFGGANDGGCRVCGEDGHFARDCPQKGEGGGGLTGECYNCGEVGHNKADCTNPRVEREFTGTCRLCEQSGHRAADCPQAPPKTCKVCGEEGHIGSECAANRMHVLFASLNLEGKSVEDAWKDVETADSEKDVEDIKKSIFTYAKAFPDLTLHELEQTFRDADMNTYLIAKEQAIADTHTIVNLQGKAGQKYVVSFQFSAKPKRAKFAEGWPSSPEENMTRLEEAGFVMDGLVMKCSNCNELGHGSKTCPEEKNEANKIAITCANCNEEGHRARDCPNERKSGKRGCKNCGSEEHMVKECPEPRTDLECNECGEVGHTRRDCPSKAPDVCRNCGQEGHRKSDCVNERVMQCRNCDKWGHSGKECPEPKDWSRVECSNCKEKGHTYKRCPIPIVEQETGEGDGGFGDAAGGAPGGGNGGWDDGAAAASGGGEGGWEQPAAASGGW